MKALFVCTGNSCRSVLAEYLFNHWAARKGLQEWTARSCGIAAERYFAVPPPIRKELAARGILEVNHVPQLVSRPLLEWADAVYALAGGHREALWEMFPEHRKKVRMFLESAGLGAGDVEDPIGRPEEVYAECAAIIEKGVQGLLRERE